MKLKIIHWLGILSCILLIISCFLPWAFYADKQIVIETQRTFTGFYSYQNNYGKPGKFLSFVGLITFVFTFIPKIWAKRINIFLAALSLGYAIKTFILFSSCYNNYCPQILFGLYLMLITSVIILIASILPKIKIK